MKKIRLTLKDPEAKMPDGSPFPAEGVVVSDSPADTAPYMMMLIVQRRVSVELVEEA